VDEDRWATDSHLPSMATSEESQNSDYWMGSSDSAHDEWRGSTDEIMMWMFKEHSHRDVSAITSAGVDTATSTWAYTVCLMDQEGNLCSIPSKPSGCSHITVPVCFNGQKHEFKHFWWQIRIYITANEEDFSTDKSMVLFTLLYMNEGAAKLWANAFVDKALETRDWGLWQDFLDELVRDFRDSEEPWWALEEIRRLYQGKRSAVEYFLKLKQLAGIAGIDIHKSSHVILQIEKSINMTLINQLYQLDEAPRFYMEMKNCHHRWNEEKVGSSQKRKFNAKSP
jgi:hypothetical protein